jgi:ABC-type xylose transport system permease subunit
MTTQLCGGASLQWTAILRLLTSRGPAHIARLIVTVVVDAIQCQSRRARADVAKERLEIMQPLVAHLNTAAAVVWVLAVVWLRATSPGVIPRDVFMALPTVPVVAMNQMATRSSTTTGRRIAASEHLADKGLLGSAIAPTPPHRALVRTVDFISRPAEHQQFAESLARVID